MPRTAHRMTNVSAALSQLRRTLEALVEENGTLRDHLHAIAQRASSVGGARSGRRGRRARRMNRPARGTNGAKKRGRPFRFTEAQGAEFRKQVEGGKSALSLAKELKISLPTLYNTLKRAGWKGRKAKAA